MVKPQHTLKVGSIKINCIKCENSYCNINLKIFPLVIYYKKYTGKEREIYCAVHWAKRSRMIKCFPQSIIMAGLHLKTGARVDGNHTDYILWGWGLLDAFIYLLS